MSGFILPYGGIYPSIAEDAFIAETAAVIGQVTIGAGSSIWFGCALRGDVNRITIGAKTNIQDGTVIHVNHDRDGDGGMQTVIGDQVTVGHLALLHACTLQDLSFVGMRAVVMDGAVVESHAMVAAGAVVTPGKVVRSGELWTGMPAKPRRPISDEERASIPYLAGHYATLAAKHRVRGE